MKALLPELAVRLGDLLAEAGFVKGRRFEWIRSTPLAFLALGVIFSDASNSEEAKFHIALGIRPVAIPMPNGRVPSRLDDCILTSRLGDFLERRIDIWWRMKDVNSLNTAVSEVIHICRGKLFPFLDSINNPASLMDAVGGWRSVFSQCDPFRLSIAEAIARAAGLPDSTTMTEFRRLIEEDAQRRRGRRL